MSAYRLWFDYERTAGSPPMLPWNPTGMNALYSHYGDLQPITCTPTTTERVYTLDSVQSVGIRQTDGVVDLQISNDLEDFGPVVGPCLWAESLNEAFEVTTSDGQTLAITPSRLEVWYGESPIQVAPEPDEQALALQQPLEPLSA